MAQHFDWDWYDWLSPQW